MENSSYDFDEKKWSLLKKDLKKTVGDTAYNNWLKHLNFISLEEDEVLKSEEYFYNLVYSKSLFQEKRMIIDTLEWNSLAKTSGIETGDVITEFKIENLDRPNKTIVYPFALILLFGFGYVNYRRDKIII